MIAQLLNEPFLVAQARGALEDLDDAIARKARRSGGWVREFKKQELQGLRSELDAALKALSGPSSTSSGKADLAFVPRDPVLSMLQTAFEEAIELHEPDAVETRIVPDGRRRGSRRPAVTGNSLRDAPIVAPSTGRRRCEIRRPRILSDPRYLLSGLAMIRRAFATPVPFNDRPGGPVEIASRARLVVVGDWGSGIERARDVAEQMKKAIKAGKEDRREVHVIHLGDVYYSGWKREYESRFLGPWPVARGETDVCSYSLNGNHDMYSGGKGYFETCLADVRFARQEGSSYFSLRNAHWQFLGLDTSYDDQALHGGQVGWALKEIQGHPSLKTVLLSHHQLFSAYENAGTDLAVQLAPVISTGGVTGWLWGHEHRCLVYREAEGLGFSSCVGHGGIPEYLIPVDEKHLPSPLKYDYRKTWGNGREPWNMLGFVCLDLTDSVCDLTYIDEEGRPHHSERIS
jgi:hypothetical protein